MVREETESGQAEDTRDEHHLLILMSCDSLLWLTLVCGILCFRLSATCVKAHGDTFCVAQLCNLI